MSATDRHLAERIARGERVAFEEFLDRYGERVHRLVRRSVPCEADAEDVTQEIFLSLYRDIGSFRGDSSLATWVYRVALNHCLRHGEKQRAAQVRLAPMRLDQSHDEAETERPDPAADPAKHASRRELQGTVHRALDELSQAHRDVVVLHELHGLTYGECAKVLKVPVGTVKSRLSNAFVRLRSSLGGYVLGENLENTPATPTPEPRKDPLGEAV